MVPTLRRMVPLMGMAVLGACVSATAPLAAPEPVRFTVGRESYAAGDTASATLENTGESPVGYGFCPYALERREGAGWVVASEMLMSCSQELARLEPGEGAAYRRHLPAGLEPGRYRFLAEVEVAASGSRLQVHSGEFSVVR